MSQTSVEFPIRHAGVLCPARGLQAAFAPALAASAFLLFSVQPMVSRMVLPLLGGSPAVWNTCVCFFQAMLLAGYAYADGLAVRLTLGRQIGVHALVLLAALAALPLWAGGVAPPAHANPALWLLGHLAWTVGPPFFALSATAPLLQHWFSRTTHRQARDPYFLYAGSNGGSLAALLAIPFALDPLLGLSRQAELWSEGFALVAAAVLACGMLAWRAQTPFVPARTAGSAPGLATQLRWMALAFVPSGLMLAVTTYITTDIASAPLFWVVPLAIYIGTFVWAFGRRAPGLLRGLPLFQGLALAAAGVTALMGVPSLLALAVALLAFTLTAALCHMDLAARRPEPRHLTRYYLLISVGGALGGVFNALVAPVLFPGPWEYPLLLIAACAVRPRRGATAPGASPLAAASATPLDATPKQNWVRLLGILFAGAFLIWASSDAAPPPLRAWARVAGVVLPAGALLFLSRRGAYLCIGLASLLILPLIVRMAGAEQSAQLLRHVSNRAHPRRGSHRPAARHHAAWRARGTGRARRRFRSAITRRRARSGACSGRCAWRAPAGRSGMSASSGSAPARWGVTRSRARRGRSGKSIRSWKRSRGRTGISISCAAAATTRRWCWGMRASRCHARQASVTTC